MDFSALLIRFFSFLLCIDFIICALNSLDTSSPCPIYLTISSLSRHAEDSHLEINWGPNCPNPPEWIGLYGQDPSISNQPALVTIRTENQSTGQFKTNVKLGKLHLPNGWNHNEASANAPKRISSKCLPFYIASFIDINHQTSNCLKIQPNWMSSVSNLAQIPLKELFLPGTHCSGCYNNQTHVKSILLKKFGYVQNFDIWTQLVFGIRYLDISIGYHENKNSPDDLSNFWIVNDSIFVSSLMPILKQIREFAILSGEAIVVDFGEFPIGFFNYPERHFDLIKLLNQELGDIAFTRDLVNGTIDSGDLTLSAIRREGKHILITYNDNEHIKVNDLVWPSWRKFNTIHLKSNELKNYMRKTLSKKFTDSPKNTPWILYGIQGVDTSYLPGLHLPSARERANSINRNISYWLSGPWCMKANVVALDFFLGSNLIDIAVHANLQKKLNSTQYLVFDVQD